MVSVWSSVNQRHGSWPLSGACTFEGTDTARLQLSGVAPRGGLGVLARVGKDGRPGAPAVGPSDSASPALQHEPQPTK